MRHMADTGHGSCLPLQESIGEGGVWGGGQGTCVSECGGRLWRRGGRQLHGGTAPLCGWVDGSAPRLHSVLVPALVQVHHECGISGPYRGRARMEVGRDTARGTAVQTGRRVVQTMTANRRPCFFCPPPTHQGRKAAPVKTASIRTPQIMLFAVAGQCSLQSVSGRGHGSNEYSVGKHREQGMADERSSF